MKLKSSINLRTFNFNPYSYVNPQPCGFLGDTTHQCSCAPISISRYQKKISGPLLDRIDIHVDVPAVQIDKLTQTNLLSEDSATIKQRVQHARDRQIKRFSGTNIYSNAEMTTKDSKKFCQLSQDCANLLKTAVEKLQLSARSYYRIIKLSQTIADLAGSEEINPEHIAESLQYRVKTSI